MMDISAIGPKELNIHMYTDKCGVGGAGSGYKIRHGDVLTYFIKES